VLGGSEPRYTDQVGTFLNNVLLGVGITEETAYGVVVMNELDCRVGGLGCGGVIVENEAGTPGVRVVLISEAGDEGMERLELYES